jgi:PAS domain-containing protein
MPPVNLNSQPQSSSGSTPQAGAVGGIAVLSADVKGKVTSCNDAALRIFGCTAAEALGRTLVAFISGKDGAEQSQLQKTMLTAVLEDGQYQSSHSWQNKAEKNATVNPRRLVWLPCFRWRQRNQI